MADMKDVKQCAKVVMDWLEEFMIDEIESKGFVLFRDIFENLGMPTNFLDDNGLTDLGYYLTEDNDLEMRGLDGLFEPKEEPTE